MATDERDLLETLKFELSFLEQGGYGRSVRTPWKPTALFQDSLTCLNFGDKEKVHPCNECLLYPLVPQDSQNETVPCHHIPLDEKGTTIEKADCGNNQFKLEEALKAWLRATIQRLEAKQVQAATRPPAEQQASH